MQTSLTLEGAVCLVSAQLNSLYEENAQTNLMYFRPSYRKSLMYICTQNWILPGPIISLMYTLLFHYYAGNISCAWTRGRVKFQNIKNRPGWTSIDRWKGSKTHKVREASMFDIHVSFKLIPALRYLPKANFVFNLRWWSVGPYWWTTVVLWLAVKSYLISRYLCCY